MKTLIALGQLIVLWLLITAALAIGAALLVAIDPLQGTPTIWRAT